MTPATSSFQLAFKVINCNRKSKMTPFIIIFGLGFFAGISANSDLRVTLQQGTLIGAQRTNRVTKEPYYAFLGIPYAKPPLGEKRFKDPEDPLPWNGILNATQEGTACMTYNVIFKIAEGNEDCLQLNIYTRKIPEEMKKSPKPVMVWIHGGAFVSGSGRPSAYGPDFLIRNDIVLVSINYRLNVFGFLSVQNDLVPGNAGLKDQVKALKWIKENIAAFGGDPDSVTIFGESAGAASVHYLMLSPSAKGLFHKAIAQSGVAINPWASTRHVIDTAFNLGEVFDCNTQNSYELIDCLQQVKAKDLVSYQFNILSMKSTDFLTKNINLPCVEPNNTKNGFLTQMPKTIMEEGRFNDVPFLLGVVKFETLILEMQNVPTSVTSIIIEQMNSKPELLLPRNLAFESAENAKLAGKKMKEFYFQNQTISNQTIDNLINMTSDSWFIFGVHETSLLHSKNGKSPVYLYHFVIETEFGESEKPFTLSRPGPSHADDIKYFFYSWDKDIKISPEEMEKISQINDLWINFAIYGNPTPNENTTTWQAFTPEEQYYLEIGDKFFLKTELEKERMEFWDKLTTEENVSYI